MTALFRTLALALAALLLTAGCGIPMSGSATALDPELMPSTRATPTGLVIPSIGLDRHGHVDALGIDSGGVIEVPPVTAPERLGWYELGVRPGKTGPAVMLGHVNGSGRDGVFARLAEVKPGDEVDVPLTNGDIEKFVVDRVQTVPKDRFPTAAVYGDTDGPELRLLTCGGRFDSAAGSYEDQVIVYASGVDTTDS